jgi:hypothetical protein
MILAVPHGGLGSEMVNQRARGPAAIFFDVVQCQEARPGILLGKTAQVVEARLLDRRRVKWSEISMTTTERPPRKNDAAWVTPNYIFYAQARA